MSNNESKDFFTIEEVYAIACDYKDNHFKEDPALYRLLHAIDNSSFPINCIVGYIQPQSDFTHYLSERNFDVGSTIVATIIDSYVIETARRYYHNPSDVLDAIEKQIPVIQSLYNGIVCKEYEKERETIINLMQYYEKEMQESNIDLCEASYQFMCLAGQYDQHDDELKKKYVESFQSMRNATYQAWNRKPVVSSTNTTPEHNENTPSNDTADKKFNLFSIIGFILFGWIKFSFKIAMGILKFIANFF